MFLFYLNFIKCHLSVCQFRFKLRNLGLILALFLGELRLQAKNVIFWRWATCAALSAIQMMSDFFRCSTTIHSLGWMSSSWSCHRCSCSAGCLNWTKSWSQVVSSSNQVKLSSFPTIQCIIWCTIIVKVKVSLYPLKHLKIILILCFHQFSRLKSRITSNQVYINISCDPRLLKGILQNLIIGGILIVVLG